MTVNRFPRPAAVLAAMILSAILNARLAAAAPTIPWVTNGPPAEDILSLAIDPLTPTTVYAGAELGRIFKSTNRGGSWNLLDTGLLTGANALVITPDASAIYVGTDNGAFVSTNAGSSWDPAGLDATVVNALVIDPNAPSTIYAGTGGGGGDQGIFRGTVGSTQWTPMNSGLPDTVVHGLATDPLQPEHTFPTTLFAVTDAGLFRSVDQAANWLSASSGLPDAALNVIVPDPINLFTLYLGTDVGVFVSNDIGQSWQAAADSFTSAISSIAIDPTSGNLYAGTFGDGVFASTDGGANWSDYNSGLTNGVVRALAIDAGSPPTLFAGTIGDGVFLTHPATQCLGDCDGSGDVTVNEIIAMVNIDLGSADVTTCPAADPDNTGMVDIAQIIAAVNNALVGCPL